MTAERDDHILAGEYVVGALAEEARADVEIRIKSDAGLERAVELWRTRFAAFDESAEEIIPDDELWLRVERSLAERAPVAGKPVTGIFFRFWSSLTALRAAAIGSTVAAAVFAVVAAASFQHARDMAARKPVYVAILVNDATKQAGAVVNAFADGRVEMIPLTDIEVPDGRTLQIWTLWDRSVGPRSVGLIDSARSTQLNLEQLPATGADQLFEITLEPAGGSPIGRPTGPILFKGTTSRAL